jgi:hypothetical protein
LAPAFDLDQGAAGPTCGTIAGMLFEGDYLNRPTEISRFVRLWLAALAASAVIAIWMIDYSISMVGLKRALLVNFVLFAIAIGLMMWILRRRSNIARWLLAVPFNLLILMYDLAHFDEEMRRGALAFIAVARLALMALATWHLFTRPARAWFGGRWREEQ